MNYDGLFFQYESQIDDDNYMIGKKISENGCQTDRKQQTNQSEFSNQNHEMLKLLTKSDGQRNNLAQMNQRYPTKSLKLIQNNDNTLPKVINDLFTGKKVTQHKPMQTQDFKDFKHIDLKRSHKFDDVEYQLEHYQNSPKDYKLFSSIFNQISLQRDDTMQGQRYETPQFTNKALRQSLTKNNKQIELQRPTSVLKLKRFNIQSQVKLNPFDLKNQFKTLHSSRQMVLSPRNRQTRTLIKALGYQKPDLDDTRSPSLHITQLNYIKKRQY